MKAVKIILGVLLIITTILVIVFAYYGGFKKIHFEVSQQDAQIMIYEDLVGDYSQSMVIFEQMHKSLQQDFNIESTKGVGIYYDDPQKVEKSKLRSEIGYIINPDDTLKLAGLIHTYQIKTIPEGVYIATEFPFKGSLSIMIGIMKVYPAFNKYLKENEIEEDTPILEIYDTAAQKIIYKKKTI